ncbi:MAG: ATP-binding protein [Chloroflexi bacterium]|nr:ATP-binding protein [Chloroflexota bacterium]
MTTGTAAFVYGLPDPPLPELQRDALLATLTQDISPSATRVDLVVGPPGIGKSTLLSQFFRTNREQTIALFLDEPDRYTYDPTPLRTSLIQQVTRILGKETTDAAGFDGELQLLYRDLSRRSQNKRFPYHFILDGLDCLQDEQPLLSAALQLLPLRMPFHIILSARRADIPLPVAPRVLPLTQLSAPEAHKLLSDAGFDSHTAELLHRIAHGWPEVLSSAIRLLKNGTPERVSALLANIALHTNTHPERWLLEQLFAAEWEFMPRDDILEDCLASMAFIERRHTSADLATLLGTSPYAVESALRAVTFVTITSTGEVRFSSRTIRDMVRQHLRHKADATRQKYALFLLGDTTSPATTQQVIHLRRSGRLRDVLHMLSPAYLADILRRGHSLVTIRRGVEEGIEAATQLGDSSQLLHLALVHSALETGVGGDVARAEVRARVALGQVEAALALAHREVLRETRLELLAILGRRQREEGKEVDWRVADEIRQLVDQIDPSLYGERLADVTEDLFYISPDLATKLLRRADPTTTRNAVLGTAAMSSPSDLPESIASILALLAARSEDVLRQKPPEEVMKWCAALDDVEARLDLLTFWLRANRRHPEAAVIVNHGLDVIVGAGSYTPTARVLRRLAEPVPFVDDSACAQRLIERLEAARSAVQAIGPTEELLRLDLSLAAAKLRRDATLGREALVALWMDISEQTDPVVRARAFAYMKEYLDTCGMRDYLESTEGLPSLVDRELKAAIEEVLRSTADQYAALAPALRALARVDPAMAITLIAVRLNSPARRDRAYHDTALALLRAHSLRVDWMALDSLLHRIEDTTSRDETVAHAIAAITSRFLSASRGVSDAALRDDVRRFLRQARAALQPWAQQIEAYDERCLALSRLARWAATLGDTEAASTCLAHLHDPLESMESVWERVSVRFMLASELAQVAPQDAEAFLRGAEAERDALEVEGGYTAAVYLTFVVLAIRVLALLPNADSDKRTEEEARLATLIDAVPDTALQADLWAEYALRMHCWGRPAAARRVVLEQVLPRMRGLHNRDRGAFYRALSTSFPAIYITEPLTALSFIETAPARLRDWMVLGSAIALLRKQVPWEVSHFDGHPPDVDVRWEDVLPVLKLLPNVDSDYALYDVIKLLVDAVSPKRAARLTRDQSSELLRALREVIDQKLPDNRYIAHEGWKIACEAQLLRLARARDPEWQRLFERARRVDNAADRPYVFALVAEAGGGGHVRHALTEAIDLCADVPDPSERVHRLAALLRTAAGLDRQLAQRCLRSGIATLAQIDDTWSRRSALRHVVDSVYRVDPELSTTVAAALDDDEARKQIREELQEEVRLSDAGRRLADPRTPPDQIGQGVQLPRHWEIVGRQYLGALLSGRVAVLTKDRAEWVMRKTASLPAEYAYPGMAAVIESIGRTYRNTPEGSMILGSMFQACVLAADFTRAVSARNASDRYKVKRFVEGRLPDEGIWIRPGERATALNYIQEWLEQEQPEWLWICDQYFREDDLEALALVARVVPVCDVTILTSRAAQRMDGAELSLRERYRQAWHRTFAQDPPFTRIVIAGVGSEGRLPIHDRYWITEGSGLLLGTSFNGLGVAQASSIWHLDQDKARLAEDQIAAYVRQVARLSGGERVEYVVISL